MKKWFIRSLFLLFLFVNPSVLADDLQVSAYHIDVSVQQNGDLAVSEEMTFQADRHYNGVYYHLDKQETEGTYTQVTDISASEKTDQGEQVLTESSSGQEQTYQLSDTGSYLKFKLFLPLDANARTVLLRYTLKSSVINYLDVAEINRKFVGQGWDIDQENIRIHIRFPKALSADTLKAWGHASDQGEVRIDPDYKGVTFTSPRNQSGDFIETRVLFSPDVTADNPNRVSEKAWDRIAQEEGQRAYERLRHQKEIEEEKKQAHTLSISLLPIMGTTLLGVYFFVHRPYKRWTEKLPLVPEHLFDIPRDISPAVMHITVFKKLDGADMGATLLDLVRKKKVALDSLTNDSGFTLLSRENLLPHEEVLISLLFDKISSNQSWVTLSQIKRYAKKHPSSYANRIEDFRKAARNQAPHYTDQDTRFSAIYTWISSSIAVLALLASLWTLRLSMDFFPYTMIVLVFGIFIFLSNRFFSKRRTLEEEYEYRQWKAFKQMLIDISRLDTADIAAVTIWDHILVYAVSLGVAKNVIHRLKEVFPEGLPDTDWNTDYQRFIYNTAFFHQFNNSFQQSYETATSINASGSGGGFSGGSSGGFGGGSGGGGF
ncbi:DUF2207 domain-containing protein [Streptococcus pneumoniae]